MRGMAILQVRRHVSHFADHGDEVVTPEAFRITDVLFVSASSFVRH